MVRGKKKKSAELDFQVLLGNHGPCVLAEKEQDCPVYWLARSSEANT